MRKVRVPLCLIFPVKNPLFARTLCDDFSLNMENGKVNLSLSAQSCLVCMHDLVRVGHPFVISCVLVITSLHLMSCALVNTLCQVATAFLHMLDIFLCLVMTVIFAVEIYADVSPDCEVYEAFGMYTLQKEHPRSNAQVLHLLLPCDLWFLIPASHSPSFR